MRILIDKKELYDHNVLCNEIEKLDLIQHNHSLIAIKDSFSTGKEFLLYYDEKWDCKLFLNYKTQDRNNEAALKEYVAADLQLDKNQIICKYKTSRVQEKYSVSHKENRVYNHRLYEMEIGQFPECERKKDFILNNKHYYWMSIEEMEADENIIKKNLEVVDFVKEAMI